MHAASIRRFVTFADLRCKPISQACASVASLHALSICDTAANMLQSSTLIYHAIHHAELAAEGRPRCRRFPGRVRQAAVRSLLVACAAVALLAAAAGALLTRHMCRVGGLSRRISACQRSAVHRCSASSRRSVQSHSARSKFGICTERETCSEQRLNLLIKCCARCRASVRTWPGSPQAHRLTIRSGAACYAAVNAREVTLTMTQGLGPI